MHKYKIPTILLFLTLAFSACQKPEENPAPQSEAIAVNDKIKAIMEEWYLWNDQMPDLKASDYSSPEVFLKALVNKDIDKWSYIQDEESFKQFFTEGKFYGFGFGMKVDDESSLRTTFVYKDSPMDRAGVTRGFKILKIDGKQVSDLLASNTLSAAFGASEAGVTVAMEVEDLQGVVKSISVTKEEVKINSVVHKEIKQIDGKKIGYLVYNSFIDTSKEELEEAFNLFKQEGISELILDLRYNGGGSLDVAQYLANLIGASKGGTGKFVELTYNMKQQSSNKPFNFSVETSGLNIDRLFVITAKGTASASEAIINGLRPYMEVITVGDFTGGKPVGMNTWIFDGYAFLPITFKVANSRGEADYYEGIRPDGVSKDDVSVLLGDEKEDSIEEVLYFIQNGAFSSLAAKTKSIPSPDRGLILEGFRAEIGAF